MGNENHIDQGAREMAGLLAEGKVESFAGRLGADQVVMSREDFSNLIKQIKEDNDKDVAAHKHVVPLTIIEGSNGQPVGVQLKYSGWRMPDPQKIDAERDKNLKSRPIEQV